MVAVTFEARDIVVGETVPGTYLLRDLKPMTCSSQPWFPEKKKKNCILQPGQLEGVHSMNSFFGIHSFVVNSAFPHQGLIKYLLNG